MKNTKNKAKETVELPIGQPKPGRMELIPISIPDSADPKSGNATGSLSMHLPAENDFRKVKFTGEGKGLS